VDDDRRRVMKQPGGYGVLAGCRRRRRRRHSRPAMAMAWQSSIRGGDRHPYALRRPQLHTEQLSTRMKRRDGARQRIRDPFRSDRFSLGPHTPLTVIESIAWFCFGYSHCFLAFWGEAVVLVQLFMDTWNKTAGGIDLIYTFINIIFCILNYKIF